MKTIKTKAKQIVPKIHFKTDQTLDKCPTIPDQINFLDTHNHDPPYIIQFFKYIVRTENSFDVKASKQNLSSNNSTNDSKRKLKYEQVKILNLKNSTNQKSPNIVQIKKKFSTTDKISFLILNCSRKICF
jgi:hypothetical protein